MSVEEKLRSAGFRSVNEDSDQCCALCNYNKVTDDTKEDICELHKVKFGKGFDKFKNVCNAYDSSRWDALMNGILEEEKEKERAAKSIDQKQKKQQSSQKEGCYIATAVYGSYEAPEVLVLREFRDNVLKKSRGGRLFIRVYYALSPELANKLKNHRFINNKVKGLLDRIVVLIKNKDKCYK